MTRVLPMFPLGTVLFPHALLPLHVFEPRYRVMMRDCMHDDHEFGVVLIERGSEVGGGDTRFTFGTLARIVQISELPDGRYALAAVGTVPIRIERWLDDDPYPRAEISEVVTEALEGTARVDATATVARIDRALHRLLELWSTIDPRASSIEVRLAADPEQASFEAAALAPIGPLDAQRVLEASGAGARLDLLEALLADEIEVLEARLRDR